MKNKSKGFTLVEIISVIALIAIISVSAIAAVNYVINKQRENLAGIAEEHIAEASMAFFGNKKSLYIEPCKDKEGDYIGLNQTIIKMINEDVRKDITGLSNEEKYNYAKNYVKNINTDNTKKEEFNNSYFNFANNSCFKLVTVGELIEEGLLEDRNNMCNKASIVVVYQKGDVKNKSGVLSSAQEPQICNGKKRKQSIPSVTVQPFNDNSKTGNKTIKISITDENNALLDIINIDYSWSTNSNDIPTDWTSVSLDTNKRKGSINLEKTGLDGKYYLWIKSDNAIDKFDNKITPFVAGPYSFIPIVTVAYNDNGGKGCSSKTKDVIFSKLYGQNVKGEEELLCIPNERSGYTFNRWDLEGVRIDNTNVVNKKDNHILKAIWTNNKYQVTFDTQGGSSCSNNSKEVTYGQAYGTLCNTNRGGYNFTGWNTEPDGIGKSIDSTSIVEIPENHTLYAQWAGAPLNMTYHENGGTSCSTNPTVVYKESQFGDLCETEREDYDFQGWYYDSSFTGEPIDEQDIVENTGDFDVYAKWQPRTVTLSYDNEDGAITCSPDSVTQKKGEKWGTLCTPTKTNYEFLGWYYTPQPEDEEPDPESIAADDDEEPTEGEQEETLPEGEGEDVIEEDVEVVLAEEEYAEPILITKNSIAEKDITVSADWRFKGKDVTRTIESSSVKKTITIKTSKVLTGTNKKQKFTCKNIDNIKSCTCVKIEKKKVKCTVKFKKAISSKNNAACQKLAKMKGKKGTWQYITNKAPAASKNNYNRASTGSGCYKLIGYSPKHTGSNWICKREPYTMYNARKEHCKYVSGSDITYSWDSGRKQCRCYDYLGKVNTYYKGTIKVTLIYK